MTGSCSLALLESALTGNLPPEAETTLESHLESCEACKATLVRLAGGAALCVEAKSFLIEDELDEAVPTRDEWSMFDFAVEHLEPADEPNVLGRLGGYDILEIIGRGGNGVVLKAFDRELKRCVAIKVLAPHIAHSSLAKKRFAREAQAAAAVIHPNVLAIYQVQPSGRLPFLVMPLVAGESLAQRLTAQGTLELKEILRIGMQAAAGLAAAHEQGLVHRDVKPANILLEKGVERAVLTDFGLARAADDATLTRWGIIAGTPQYMSPEQARGEALDGRSDLFGLGCVLYEMATGVSPFRTDSLMATMRRLVDDSPQAMASLNPELPPWFIAIVSRLLEKEPSKRFNSAKEVSELLEGCLAHLQQPTSVPLPTAIPPYTVPQARRARIRRWASVLAGLLAVGIGAWAVLAATEPPDIAGEWSGGDNWGQVTLKATDAGAYTGTYTATLGKQPGEIQLKWSRIERRFNGTWHEGKDRLGDLSLHLVGNEIHGALTTDAKSKINPATPRLADLTWIREPESGVHENVPQSISSFGPVIERFVGPYPEGNCQINLKTGKLFSFDKKLHDDPKAFDRWLIDNGVDANGAVIKNDGDKEAPALMGLSFMYQSVAEETWDAPASLVVAQINQFPVGRLRPIKMASPMLGPATYVFKTREGAGGILQITGLTVERKEVAIRYKLVQDATTAQTSGTPGRRFDLDPLANLASVENKAAQPAWGKVGGDGLQIRATVAKDRFAAEEIPIVTLDLRNTGSKTVDYTSTPVLCRLQVDSYGYVWSEEGKDSDAIRRLKPGDVHLGILSIPLSDKWTTKDRYSKPLKLAPGKHVVQIDFSTSSGTIYDSAPFTIEIDQGPKIGSMIQVKCLVADVPPDFQLSIENMDPAKLAQRNGVSIFNTPVVPTPNGQSAEIKIEDRGQIRDCVIEVTPTVKDGRVAYEVQIKSMAKEAQGNIAMHGSCDLGQPVLFGPLDLPLSDLKIGARNGIATHRRLVGSLVFNRVEQPNDTVQLKESTKISTSAKTNFGPVIERTIPYGQVIDFLSGRVMEWPEKWRNMTRTGDIPDEEKWIKDAGVAASAEGDGLRGHGTIAAPCTRKFEEVTVDQVLKATADLTLEKNDLLPSKNGAKTLYFRTREGTSGILQIVDLGDKSTGLKIRYKLVQNASDQAPVDSVSNSATFGPVIERVVNDQYAKEGNNCIDLETGRLLTMPEPKKADFIWVLKNHVDAVCAMDGSPSQGLMAMGGTVVQLVANDQFDTIQAEAVIENTIWQKADFGNPIALVGKLDAAWKSTLPVTYLVRTSRGGMGVLQIKSFTDNPRGVKIRYKLVKNASDTAPATSADKSATLGPVIERVVGESPADNSFINLKTGKLFSVDMYVHDDAKRYHHWLIDNGIDAGVPRLNHGDKARAALDGHDTRFYSVAKETWDAPDDSVIAQIIQMPKIADGRGSAAEMADPMLRPATYLFKTREGAGGILQVMGFSEEPKGVKIRYKLVQGEAAKTSDGPTEKDAQRANLQAELQQGKGSGRVELVALAKFPTAGSPWWTPDGRLLTEPPVDPSESDIRSSVDPKHIWYTALFRIPGGLDWGVGGDRIQGTNGPWIWAGGQFRKSRLVNDLAALAIGLPANAQHADLTIQVARGSWRNIAMVKGQRLKEKDTTSESDTEWKVMDREGRIRLFVDYPKGDVQARVAFQSGGEATVATNSLMAESPSKDKTRIETQFSKLDLESGSFVLQTRPYEKVVFRNVALSPNPKSAPTKLSAADMVLRDKTEWGKPNADGLQIRATVAKDRFGAEETPVVTLDLRNTGAKPLDYIGIPEVECQVQVDSHLYVWSEGVDVDRPSQRLNPGEERLAALSIPLSDKWAMKGDNDQHLKLAPGKHEVRIEFRPSGFAEANSNPIAIEIDRGLSEKAKKTVDALLADIEHVQIMLEHRPQKQPGRHSLLLSAGEERPSDLYLRPRVTKEQMKKLLLRLAADGFFDRASGGAELPPKPPEVKNAPGYMLILVGRVPGGENISVSSDKETGKVVAVPVVSVAGLFEDLSLREGAAVEVAKAIRSVLDGEAATAADTILREMGAQPGAVPRSP